MKSGAVFVGGIEGCVRGQFHLYTSFSATLWAFSTNHARRGPAPSCKIRYPGVCGTIPLHMSRYGYIAPIARSAAEAPTSKLRPLESPPLPVVSEPARNRSIIHGERVPNRVRDFARLLLQHQVPAPGDPHRGAHPPAVRLGHDRCLCFLRASLRVSPRKRGSRKGSTHFMSYRPPKTQWTGMAGQTSLRRSIAANPSAWY